MGKNASDSKRLCVEPDVNAVPEIECTSLPSPKAATTTESEAVTTLKRSFALERVFLVTVDTSDDRASLLPAQSRERPNFCFLLEVRMEILVV